MHRQKCSVPSVAPLSSDLHPTQLASPPSTGSSRLEIDKNVPAQPVEQSASAPPTSMFFVDFSIFNVFDRFFWLCSLRINNHGDRFMCLAGNKSVRIYGGCASDTSRTSKKNSWPGRDVCLHLRRSSWKWRENQGLSHCYAVRIQWMWDVLGMSAALPISSHILLTIAIAYSFI